MLSVNFFDKKGIDAHGGNGIAKGFEMHVR
jgi:hypothetical protein